MARYRLSDDVAAVGVSEEVVRLIDEIETTCHEKPCGDVLDALWLILFSTLVAVEECSVPEAVEHVQNWAKRLGQAYGVEAIAAHSPRH
jgi:hypothetical protein